ncbi:hypothetical protein [Sphingobacterium luzhongxinii]|uniref:hypothetical protein n=1 Tax=Sphingobacterium luzhongxinii TaxID=2654181 RepID=UPI0013DC3442|nr:hypothetical protein [Sphingobacterium sp. xlx-73]
MDSLLRYGLMLFWGILLFLENSFAQSVAKPKIYYVADLKSSKFNDYVQKNNIIKIQYLLDGKYLGKKNDFTFSKAELLGEVKRIFPHASDSGYAYLDIEDPYMEILMNNDVKSQKFIKSEKLYLDVLEYAKKLRPNVKWGYYGIPFTTYWGRDSKFYSKNQKISAILQKVDVFFPSLYIFYNNVGFSFENSSYLKDNTRETLKLASRYNKNVFAFIMSRYHPSNNDKRFMQISDDDFTDYVSSIVKTSSNGKTVNGIVLWNVDNYFYSTDEPAIITDFKRSKARNFDLFYENYLINQFQLINKEIK